MYGNDELLPSFDFFFLIEQMRVHVENNQKFILTQT